MEQLTCIRSTQSNGLDSNSRIVPEVVPRITVWSDKERARIMSYSLDVGLSDSLGRASGEEQVHGVHLDYSSGKVKRRC